MRWTIGLIAVILFYSFTDSSRTSYPLDFFQAPVAEPLRLSGTFGELRPNHFHSGIDIKGSIGVPILSAGAGVVSRIKVAPDGYGNHLYVDHGNGYTTVYAHLQEFSPEIEQYVREMQFKEQEFELEMNPEKNRFPVRKGQLIGRMGNTGHSFGPHLHFEIRETASDKPINPLLFGLKVEDRIPPRLHEIKVYEFNEQLQSLRTRTLPLVFKNGTYQVAAGALSISSNLLGLAVKAYDHMDGVSNWNGIYSMELLDDSDLVYGFRMESFRFKESRYLNAHIDYREQSTRGSYFHRCFTLPGNLLSIYLPGKNGLVSFQPGETNVLQLSVRDIAGNTSKLELQVRRETENSLTPPSVSPYQYFLPYDRPYVMDNYQIYLNFPKEALYENLYMQYRVREEGGGSVLSPIHSLHHKIVPIHRSFVLGIRPFPIPERVKSKAFIAHRSGGSVVNYGGQWQDDGMLMTTVNTLGDFCIMLDTIPPTIEVERFSADMRRQNGFSFRIRDNVSGSGNLPNLKYRALIDGEWVLMKYDEKNRRLTLVLGPDLPSGNHRLELQVSDALDNTAYFKRNFVR